MPRLGIVHIATVFVWNLVLPSVRGDALWSISSFLQFQQYPLKLHSKTCIVDTFCCHGILRGGAQPDLPSPTLTTNTHHQWMKNNNITKPLLSIRIKTVLGITLALSTSYAIYRNRQQLLDKKYLQDKALILLQNANHHPWGLLYYILGMALWEALGLSTIPVETAAGMAFGFRRAVVASLLGKLAGASLAFGLGRHVLQQWVQTQLQSNPTFQLVQMSVKHEPIKTAILLKYSCFPEFIKNFGTSLLHPIPYWAFLLATLIHGGPFSYLWTWLGDDTAQRLKHENLPPNRALQSTLGVAMTVGLVLSPVAMAWWIRELQKEYQTRKVVDTLPLPARANVAQSRKSNIAAATIKQC